MNLAGLGSKSRRLWHDSFIYRLNSLLINCRSFRVLTKALFIEGCHIENQGKHELKLHAARKYKIIRPRGEADILEPPKLIRQAVQMRKQSRHKRGLSSQCTIYMTK